MTAIFDDVAEKYFKPFSLNSLTAEQQACYDYTREVVEDVLSVKGRERYLQDLVICVGGLGPADEKETLNDNCFSVYQFYEVYTCSIVGMVDKFDYLMRALEAVVCVVASGFEDRFRKLIQTILTMNHTLPTEFADRNIIEATPIETPRCISEIPRTCEETHEKVQLYCERSDRLFPSHWRSELKELESEQRKFEESVRPKVFTNWHHPTGPGDPVPPSEEHLKAVAELRVNGGLLEDGTVLNDGLTNSIKSLCSE